LKLDSNQVARVDTHIGVSWPTSHNRDLIRELSVVLLKELNLLIALLKNCPGHPGAVLVHFRELPLLASFAFLSPNALKLCRKYI